MNGLKATSTHRSNVARLKLLFGPPLTRSMSFEEAPRQWGDLRMRSSWRLGASKHHGISAHWALCTIPSQFLGMKQYLCMDQVIKNDVDFLWHAQFSWFSPCSMRFRSFLFMYCFLYHILLGVLQYLAIAWVLFLRLKILWNTDHCGSGIICLARKHYFREHSSQTLSVYQIYPLRHGRVDAHPSSLKSWCL